MRERVRLGAGPRAGGALLARYTGDTNSRSFVPLNGGLLAEYYCGGVIFDHPDELGSATTATDCTGKNVQERLYYPFGESWNGAGSLGMHQEFAQLPDYDPETDQYNTPNRHYTPMGRWLTPDPSGVKAARLDDPQTWNMYAYARNNPTTVTDPSGLAPATPAWGTDFINWIFTGMFRYEQAGDYRGAPAAEKPQASEKAQQQNTLSAAGLKFIECHEAAGCQPNLTAYDASGKKHLGDWTIGYGHKIKPGEDFSKGINADQAADLLRADVQTAVNAVNSALKVPVSYQGQFDAMVSLAYNIGGGAFAGSTLVQRFNGGGSGVVEQPDLFTRWSKTGGAFSSGLYARREDEYTLFNTGQYP